MKIRQEKYFYLHTSETIFQTREDCLDESYYNCAISEVIDNNFEGWNCTKNCFSSSMISLGQYDENLTCEDIKEQQCSGENFQIYAANCLKPCSIVQYTGRVDYWEDANSNLETSSFTFYLRFSQPLTSTVNQEYIIYDIFGMIGSVGGTLGIFIGFSFSGMLSFITHIFKNLPYKNIKDKSAIICNCIPQKSSDN